MENSYILLLFLVSIASLLFSTKALKRHRLKNLPAGPKPWPIIGNLNLLGPIPHQSLHQLSKKYGQIMLLKFGKFPVVVASSPEMAKQFLRVHDATFASRPALAAGKHTAYNYSDMTWAPYGPYWRQARKIFFSEVFSAKRLESSERIRVQERVKFLSRLASLKGNPVAVRDHLYGYTMSIMCRMVLGEKFLKKFEMDELREMVDEWFLLNGVFNVGDWIPWISWFDLQGYVRKMKSLKKRFDCFHNSVIEDHLARRDEGNDVVGALLRMADDPNLEVQLTRDCVKALIQDLLLGGIDTSATIVEWAIHEILRQPRIIEKAKAELNNVIGRDRWVEENDFPHLPYVDAIIKETFRLHPVGTLLGPHYATQDCNVAGYDIRKGTTILINAWSIGRDPNSWDEPESFLPERFVGRDTDVLGSNFALLPFGSGRRRCPGHNLGLKLVRTTLANLLHGFDLKLVGMKAEDVSLEEEYGLTTHPKYPLTISMEPTLPTYLYQL